MECTYKYFFKFGAGWSNSADWADLKIQFNFHSMENLE